MFCAKMKSSRFDRCLRRNYTVLLMINEGRKNQLGAIIAKAVKQGFLAPDQPTFQEICDSR